MRFSQLTVSRRVFALSFVALAALPAAGEAALIRYTFTGKVTSQSWEAPFVTGPLFGDQLGETVQITALLDPDRLDGVPFLFLRTTVSTEVPQPGGGTASIANAEFGRRNLYSYNNRYGFLALIARFADGQEFDPAKFSSGNLEREERVSIYNDTHAPGVAEPSDALYISATNTPYFEYGANGISITGNFSSSALSSAAFGEIPVLSSGDNVTATLTSYFGSHSSSYRFSYVIDVFTIDARPAVPEPGTYAFITAGIIGVSILARRRMQNQSESPL